MDEELKKILESAVAANPDLVEKFGNPLDQDDPRNWTPTKRAEQGLPLEEQFRLLGLDMEAQRLGFASLTGKLLNLDYQLDIIQKWVADQMAKEFAELVKNGEVDKAMAMMQKLMGAGEEAPPGQWGPLENSPDASVRYAGSATGIAPDQMVETPQGIIRGDQIPGFKNDPNWRPSPDWMDANCMCPSHVAQREHGQEDPSGGFGGTGLYL